MTHCQVLTFETPDGYLLNGLWFGADKPLTGYIFLHGLSSSAFSHHQYLLPLMNSTTAALFFNNRGHDKIGKVHKFTADRKDIESQQIGEAHEVFEDCVDDIEGAVNLLLAKGVENIYLVGHSTGTQKAIYYLSQPGKQKLVSGVVLVCPISDYAYAAAFEDPLILDEATKAATKLVGRGKDHELLPPNIWPDLLDAQRFLSLYTPSSTEEIFSYAQANKVPETLKKVTIPILVLLAEKDEYSDRSADKLKDWFIDQSVSEKLNVQIIKDSLHNLNDHESEVSDFINRWQK